MVPGLLHAGNYCATNHWLKAVKAAGTTDADAVVAKMKATPVNDFYNTNVKIREDGRVMHVMYLWQVKPVAQAKSKYDFCNQLATISPAEAWRPMSEGRLPAGQGINRIPSGEPVRPLRPRLVRRCGRGHPYGKNARHSVVLRGKMGD